MTVYHIALIMPRCWVRVRTYTTLKSCLASVCRQRAGSERDGHIAFPHVYFQF